MFNNIRLPLAITSSLCLFFNGPASAHDTMDAQKDLRELVEASDLIIHGRVIAIQYRNSRPSRDEPNGVPHTFVTYQLYQSLRGNPPDDLLTLRFVGGADGRGGVYMDTSTPTFARGQEDILILEGGELDDCPLVDCVEGRFRVLDGRMYNGWGVPIVEAREHLRMGGIPRADVNIMEFPRPSFDAIIQRPEVQQMIQKDMPDISLAELRSRYEAQAPEHHIISYEIPAEDSADIGGGRPASPMESYGPPMSLQDFSDVIRSFNEEVTPPRNRLQLSSPDTPFSVPAPQASPFQFDAEHLNINPEELREMESMQEGLDTGVRAPNLREPNLPDQPARPTIDPGRTPQIDPRPESPQIETTRPETTRPETRRDTDRRPNLRTLNHRARNNSNTEDSANTASDDNE